MTRQDLYTFLIGLGAAVLYEFGTRAVDSEAIVSDPHAWAGSLAVGLLSAVGRYLVTYLTQRTFEQVKVVEPERVDLLDVVATEAPKPKEPSPTLKRITEDKPVREAKPRRKATPKEDK